LLSTRTIANEVAMQWNNGNLGCQEQEKCEMSFLSTRAMRLLSIRTITSEVTKHKSMGNSGCEAQEQWQMRLLSTITRPNKVGKLKNKGI